MSTRLAESIWPCVHVLTHLALQLCRLAALRLHTWVRGRRAVLPETCDVVVLPTELFQSSAVDHLASRRQRSTSNSSVVMEMRRRRRRLGQEVGGRQRSGLQQRCRVGRRGCSYAWVCLRASRPSPLPPPLKVHRPGACLEVGGSTLPSQSRNRWWSEPLMLDPPCLLFVPRAG